MTAWKKGERVVPGISGPCGRCADCHGGRAIFARPATRIGCGEPSPSTCGSPPGLWPRTSPRPRRRGRRGRGLPGSAGLGPPRLEPFAGAFGTLLIYGAGALAFLWAAVARRHGLEVVIAGRRADRAPLAARFGARYVDRSQHGPEALVSETGGPPDLAVDCTGDGGVWELLPELVRPGGQVLLFGGCAPGTAVRFDAARLHYAEITLTGAFHYTPTEARAALDALASRNIDPRPLITARGTLADLPRFLDAQQKGEGVRYAIMGG